MRKLAIFVSVIFALGTPAPAQTSERHLVYQFGYNTAVATSGQGTGTTTIDVKGVAADGGVIISGQDYWWNTARPRATNTCEVYATGNVSCSERPMQYPDSTDAFSVAGARRFQGAQRRRNLELDA